MKFEIFILVFISIEVMSKDDGWSFVSRPLINALSCKNVTYIVSTYQLGTKSNMYDVHINKKFTSSSQIDLRFDAPAQISLRGNKKAKININALNSYTILLNGETGVVDIVVKGLDQGFVPYLDSLMIDRTEICYKPAKGYFDRFITGEERKSSVKPTAQVQIHIDKVDNRCGRRKVTETALIVNGKPTKPGDWPWHVAIYRLYGATISYICGGTLLSKNFVLTGLPKISMKDAPFWFDVNPYGNMQTFVAAHCATLRGQPVLPEILNIVLGKYNLVGGDIASEEREVFKIIVHEKFNHHTRLNNDIALLKMSSEVSYNAFIQPACLWDEHIANKIPHRQIYGTVAGWGFDQTNELANQLQQATMPIIRESNCIKSNPLFYSSILDENKFCAGWRNGTSACNGDSGGGFFVFVQDNPGETSRSATGSWYVRGIVSQTVSQRDVAICDPEQYVVFTDVSRYLNWIRQYLQ